MYHTLLADLSIVYNSKWHTCKPAHFLKRTDCVVIAEATVRIELEKFSKIKMHVARWNRKRLVLLALFLVFIYGILSTSYNEFHIDTVIKDTKPEDVWDFVADFSKMKLLNPTINDFKITADSGTYHHWKYSVEYAEKLSHWPHWENIATADYSIRKLSPEEGGSFIVESKHKTCFLKGLYCLNSEGLFKISALGSDTYCLESVFYQCPPLMGNFCRREVEFQREAIIRNLTLHFNKK